MPIVQESHAEQLRQAIENLINVKLQDVLAHRNGLERLAAHRCSGVASFPIREAESHLEAALGALFAQREPAIVRARGLAHASR